MRIYAQLTHSPRERFRYEKRRASRSQPRKAAPATRQEMPPAAVTGPLQNGREQSSMDRLPQSRAPLLMSEVTAPLSPRTHCISSTVDGGRMALPQKLTGT